MIDYLICIMSESSDKWRIGESSDRWRMSEVYLRRMLALKGEVLIRFETGHLTTLYFLAEGLALLGRLQPEDVTPPSRRKR